MASNLDPSVLNSISAGSAQTSPEYRQCTLQQSRTLCEEWKNWTSRDRGVGRKAQVRTEGKKE
ncbi:uncharacterized protein N7500_004472 [Penicillium coprophilum]|uniref:uncharacterized protein n=1 Tax=Penicillium coprophilum TaxID=36646 RepID=UPI00238A6527|nr:uncharacterized protein N7500_004472 [Penicillium coprophilum]KAJ5162642.1 hypothetical protein N7500_004472 [Penicillium coprophilum]